MDVEFAKWFFFLSKTSLIDANKNLSEDAINGIWDKFNTMALILIIIMLVVSVFSAIYYYTLYNESPGRHYTPQKWALIYCIEILVVFVGSLVTVFALHPSGDINKVLGSEIQMIVINTLYSLAPYLLISWLWCQLGWPTKAYRCVKF